MTAIDVFEYVRENDVKFIRLAFSDILGTLKNISIMPSEVERAFEQGILFDASAVKGFTDVVKSDLFLKPIPSTMVLLPWRPQQGRVIRFLCDIKNPDGTLYEEDGRYILKKAVKRASEMGYECKIGPECEFYLFKTDGNGEPTYETCDRGGYLDVSPVDKGENIRREICLCLDEMGIQPETSHHEQGPGQNEIDFKYSDALAAADNFLTFKWVVKTIAARNGFYASFLPKPFADNSGSGLHINLSLQQGQRNIFGMENLAEKKITQNFIAGILDKIEEMTLFLNPIANSYERFGSFEAPLYISWSHQNRSQLVRIPAAQGEFSRMELRSPDPAANPYLAFALLINAGLDGIDKNLELSEPVNINLYKASEADLKDLKALPTSLGKAVEIAENSAFVKKVLGESMLLKYIELKRNENTEFLAASNKWEFYSGRYFKFV
jgi:glutamine synthetase